MSTAVYENSLVMQFPWIRTRVSWLSYLRGMIPQ